MPYDSANDADLPPRVKKLPLQKRQQWVRAWNRTYSDCMRPRGGGGSQAECEGLAFRNAYAAIKEKDVTEDKGNQTDKAASSPEGDAGQDSKGVEQIDAESAPMVEVAPKPLGGALSFGDADAYREARDQESHIYGQERDFHAIFDNIMADEDMTLEQKAAAVVKAGQELGKRVRQGPEGQKGLLGRFKDAVWPTNEKARWTTAYINDLPDSAFAYIEPGGKKDEQGKTVPRRLRHFPYKNANGKVDLPHLRNALARAPQSPFGPKAMPKLRAAAERAGIGKYGKGLQGAFTAFKDVSGVWRWISVTTNKFKDLEGEIFSDEAHKEYVDYVDKMGDLPELWLWHVPGSRIGEADFVGYTDGFVLHSGVFDGAEVAEVLSRSKDLGVSHGYRYEEGDEEDGVYEWYRTFEVSVLPAGKAANAYTDFAVNSKEANVMLTAGKRKFLVDHIGEERVAHIEEGLAHLSEELKEAGVEFKDLAEAIEVEEETEEESTEEAKDDKPAEEDSGDKPEPLTAEGVKAVVEEAVKAPFEELRSGIEGLAERVQSLERSDDEKLSEKMKPRRKAPGDSQRPTASKDNELPDEEAEKLRKEEEPEESPVDGYLQDLRLGRVAQEGGVIRQQETGD